MAGMRSMVTASTFGPLPVPRPARRRPAELVAKPARCSRWFPLPAIAVVSARTDWAVGYGRRPR